jgi:hypothetical protein
MRVWNEGKNSLGNSCHGIAWLPAGIGVVFSTRQTRIPVSTTSLPARAGRTYYKYKKQIYICQGFSAAVILPCPSIPDPIFMKPLHLVHKCLQTRHGVGLGLAIVGHINVLSVRPPDVLTQEIVEDLEAALEQFRDLLNNESGLHFSQTKRKKLVDMGYLSLTGRLLVSGGLDLNTLLFYFV